MRNLRRQVIEDRSARSSRGKKDDKSCFSGAHFHTLVCRWYLNLSEVLYFLFRNVVKEGDTYFNTGDLFTLGGEYDLYFNDRIGDTFRSV